MKKLLTISFLSAIFLLSAAFSVKAESCSSTDTYTFQKCSGLNDVSPAIGYPKGTNLPIEYYIGLILSIVFSLFGLIFLILIIYSGIKWMTAQGNTSQVDSAKDTITRAIIGLVICLVAYGITFFVINIFQGDSEQFIDSPIQNEINNTNPSA